MDLLRPAVSGDASGWAMEAAPWTVEAGHAAATQGTPFVSVSPNPFAQRAAFSLSLAETGPVLLTLYDIRGRAVVTLADGVPGAGWHTVVFDADGLPSGVYIWSSVDGSHAETGRITLMR